ncbi:SdpI family protein [Streptococcus merionis]|uniref:SdpI family protein n=1 Tax=Streptococcus merionis TaxID=400065 RepID=UPI0035149BFA
MKINKKLLAFTSILCLLPILVGLFYWKELPAKIPTHFNLSGQVDGYSGKFETIFFLPILMMGVHILSIIMTSISPKSQNIGANGNVLIYWLVPAIVVPIQIAAIFSAMKAIGSKQLTIGIGVVIALLFIILGNYLPKMKQNYAMRIKLPWTLDNEENWSKTHRFAGKVWVIGGLMMLIDVLLQLALPYFLIPTFSVMVIAPLIYSYLLYKKQNPTQ